MTRILSDKPVPDNNSFPPTFMGEWVDRLSDIDQSLEPSSSGTLASIHDPEHFAQDSAESEAMGGGRRTVTT